MQIILSRFPAWSVPKKISFSCVAWDLFLHNYKPRLQSPFSSLVIHFAAGPCRAFTPLLPHLQPGGRFLATWPWEIPSFSLLGTIDVPEVTVNNDKFSRPIAPFFLLVNSGTIYMFTSLGLWIPSSSCKSSNLLPSFSIIENYQKWEGLGLRH